MIFLHDTYGRAIARAHTGFTPKTEYWLRQLGNEPQRKFPGREGWTVEVMERWRLFDGRDDEKIYLLKVSEPNGPETILHFRDGVSESLVRSLQEELCAEQEREDPRDEE